MFEIIQGEGVFTGVPAVFVRLQGCPVGCAWCDTKQTWETLDSDQTSFSQILLKTNDAPTWCQATAQEVVQRYQAQGYQAKHIVITGGEPCIYDLTELTQAFEAMGCRCQIETSGTYEVCATENTWVTVSPKVAMKGKLPILDSALQRANELNIPWRPRKISTILMSCLHELRSVLKPQSLCSRLAKSRVRQSCAFAPVLLAIGVYLSKPINISTLLKGSAS